MRAAFSRAASPAGVSSAARRPVRHRRPRRSRERSRSRVRLATVMVVAAAGLGSVLAAYIDVLPSPIQRLAHVAVAAPDGSSSSQPATLGTARPAPRKVQPSSRSAPAPRHSASAALAPSMRTTPTPHYRPLFSPSDYHPTGRPAAPARGTRRTSRRRDRPVPACRRPGIRRCPVRSSPPARQASPRGTLTCPDPPSPRSSGMYQGGVIPHRAHRCLCPSPGCNASATARLGLNSKRRPAPGVERGGTGWTASGR